MPGLFPSTGLELVDKEKLQRLPPFRELLGVSVFDRRNVFGDIGCQSRRVGDDGEAGFVFPGLRERFLRMVKFSLRLKARYAAMRAKSPLPPAGWVAHGPGRRGTRPGRLLGSSSSSWAGKRARWSFLLDRSNEG